MSVERTETQASEIRADPLPPKLRHGAASLTDLKRPAPQTAELPMVEPRHDPRRNDSRDIARVTQEVASRLRGSGVDVYDNDSPEELVRLLDAVEAFERSVQRHGGDLMVDEPPDDVRGEPDDPLFLIPTRSADESVASYIRRLDALISAIRAQRPNSQEG
jgi:hypothetical protein